MKKELRMMILEKIGEDRRDRSVSQKEQEVEINGSWRCWFILRQIMRMLDEKFGMKVINGCYCMSNIYGFILFSEANYNVVKVMRDAD